VSADEAYQESDGGGEMGRPSIERDGACDFLREVLANGPVEATTIVSDANATVGRTTIIRNVSYLNEHYEPTNPPTYFELSPLE